MTRTIPACLAVFTMIGEIEGAVPPQPQPLTVLNAASFSSAAVAPGSIVTIFGSNLTNAVQAVTDPSHPPFSLGGTSVNIGGVPATLFYVSPTQINAVIATTTAAVGTQPVVVTSPTGTSSGSVSISTTAQPGLFSLTGTGTHDGAIIESLTGRVGAFSVHAGASPNFLSLFLTGASFTTVPVVTVAGVAATVTYDGPSPCCAGLEQINITLPASLAGAGRVPVMVQAGTQLSNVVEIVILPDAGRGESDHDQDNETRSREVSSIAWIPGTSLALVTDENDDVVREVDLAGAKVLRTIALASNSEPASIAVNASGTLAVVAERSGGKVALIDLASAASAMVVTEVAVGAGPVAVAINGTQAVVVNGDGSTVAILDLTARVLLKTIPVGRGPRGVAVDGASHAYITNQDDGTISVVDLTAGAVTSTISLGASRPAAIQLIAGTSWAVVADPAVSPDGKVLVVNLVTGAATPFSVNVAHDGGSGDIVMHGATAYIANQAGGSVSVLPLTFNAGVVAGTATTLALGQGVRALAFDTKDNELLAVNESTGRIAVVNAANNQIVAQISAVVAESGEGDDQGDDHSDHDHAPNLPVIRSLLPSTGSAGSSFVVTLTGSNLQGATGLTFLTPAVDAGVMHGKGTGNPAASDSGFTVTGLQVNAAGTQLTANVAIATGTRPGIRWVRVVAPNGTSMVSVLSGASFTVLP